MFQLIPKMIGKICKTSSKMSSGDAEICVCASFHFCSRESIMWILVSCCHHLLPTINYTEWVSVGVSHLWCWWLIARDPGVTSDHVVFIWHGNAPHTAVQAKYPLLKTRRHFYHTGYKLSYLYSPSVCLQELKANIRVHIMLSGNQKWKDTQALNHRHLSVSTWHFASHHCSFFWSLGLPIIWRWPYQNPTAGQRTFRM